VKPIHYRATEIGWVTISFPDAGRQDAQILTHQRRTHALNFELPTGA
jgi:hypothetical protein